MRDGWDRWDRFLGSLTLGEVNLLVVAGALLALFLTGMVAIVFALVLL